MSQAGKTIKNFAQHIHWRCHLWIGRPPQQHAGSLLGIIPTELGLDG